MHALSVRDLDSIRSYLTKAKELELLYGSTVLSDFDGSMQVHLGARPLLRETFDVQLYGLMNLSLYPTNKENSQAVAALDFGFGLALSIQVGMGGSSYRFGEESSNPQGRLFREEWTRLGDPTPSDYRNAPPNNYRRVYPHH